LRPRQGPETEGLLLFWGIKGVKGVWGKRGRKGGRKLAVGFRFLAGRPAAGFLFLGKSGRRLPVFLSDEEPVGGELAAAVVGDDGELASGDQLGKDLPDAPIAEASAALQGGLINDPLATGVAVVGDREEDYETGPTLAGVFPDGGPVLSAHGCAGRPVPILVSELIV
jgi:hypothetical protein